MVTINFQPQFNMERKKYLGDAVYFEYDGYHVVLTTENGIRATNKICLEPEVIQNLFKAIEKIEPLMRQLKIPQGDSYTFNEHDRAQWYNNCLPEIATAMSEEERRKAADAFGPNWATIMSGLGDQ